MSARDLEQSLTVVAAEPTSRRRCRTAAVAAVAGTAAVAAALVWAGRSRPVASTDGDLLNEDDPVWGCGVVGDVPGISADGTATAEAQRLIDGIKGSSTFNKVSYWNWNLAPATNNGVAEYLTKDFIFMPEQWGAGAVNASNLRQANVANFMDSNGKVSPATMGDILLGMNEPDIYGSCMGNMFGTCLKPCDKQAIADKDCPTAYLSGHERAKANERGECDCTSNSHATGMGFWGFEGCAAEQPLPTLFKDGDTACVDTVMSEWKKTAQIAVSKGYKYLSTPLVAVNIDYAADFIEKACAECQDISCGCPQYVAFHFYAYDCQPEDDDGYPTFQKRIDGVKAIMEKHPFVKGAIINEVGMLNCAGMASDPICVPDSGKYPASSDPNHQCPKNDQLPNGLATFVEKLLDMVIAAKTDDGRAVVKGFSWFKENMAGGTYNLKMFDAAGKMNEVGEAYIKGCSKWATSRQATKSV